MAFYTLHYMLFAIVKTTNPQLLLSELVQVIWSEDNLQSTSGQFDEDFLLRSPLNRTALASSSSSSIVSTYFIELSETGSIYKLNDSVLLLSNMIIFLLTTEIARSIDLNGSHGSTLMRLFRWSVICHITYLYLINTLFYIPMTCISTMMKLVHYIVLVAQFIAIQCTSQLISSLIDPQATGSDKTTPSSILSYSTYLAYGALSLAFSTLSLSEFYSLMSNPLGYTNVGIALSLMAVIVECSLAYFKAANWGHYDEKHSKGPNNIKLNERSGEYDDGCNIIGASSNQADKSKKLTSSVLTISAAHLKQHHIGETIHISDEDECNNSIYVHNIQTNAQTTKEARRSSKRSTRENISEFQDVDLYDRCKYSLYEDFERRDKEMRFTQKVLADVNLFNGQTLNPNMSKPSRDTSEKSISYILMMKVNLLPFMLECSSLLISGIVYQANQLCFISRYLGHLIKLLGSSSIETNQSILDPDEVRVIGVCLATQCLGKMISLHYLSCFIFKHSRRKILISLILFSVAISVQFLFFQYAISNLEIQTIGDTSWLISAQVLSLQFQVGVLGAFADLLINNLTLVYSRDSQVACHPEKLPGAENNTLLHALLSGVFYNLGASFALTFNSSLLPVILLVSCISSFVGILFYTANKLKKTNGVT